MGQTVTLTGYNSLEYMITQVFLKILVTTLVETVCKKPKKALRCAEQAKNQPTNRCSNGIA